MSASSSAMSTRRCVTPGRLATHLNLARRPRYPNGRGSGFKTRTVSVQIRPGAQRPEIVGRRGQAGGMYDVAIREAAVARVKAGASLRSVSLDTGISRVTLREWLTDGTTPKRAAPDCPRCRGDLPAPREDYVYLLGLYLGDGCISAHPRTTALRITCADTWPRLLAECVSAIEAVSGRGSFRTRAQGCHVVTVLWKHWPCLFPQQGPGRKHERKIELAEWQLAMVQADPSPLIRGLIHSDGCRVTNWTERRVGGTTKRYTYPRYFFTNASDDIRGIFTDALDQFGIAWRRSNARNISIARREAVAALDEFVGPKT